MPDQLTQPSLRGPGELAVLLRGALKANLVHHLAHTGARRLRRIGRAWKPTWDWLPPGPRPPETGSSSAGAGFGFAPFRRRN